MEEDVKGKENLICIPVMAKKESRKKKKVVVYSFQLFSTIECMKGGGKNIKVILHDKMRAKERI